MTGISELQIFPLWEKADLANVCAAWSFAEWRCQEGTSSLEDAITRYKNSAAGDSMPVTWIAVHKQKPAGMISLKMNDHPDIKDLNPWLGSLFVHPFHRKKGIASALINVVEREAKTKYQYKELYLFTTDTMSLYEKHGWVRMRTVRDPTGYAPEGDTLMKKEL